MSKWREWWIEFEGDPRNDKDNYKRYVSGTRFEPINLSDEIVEVIEKTAYTELKAQADLLAEALSKIAIEDEDNKNFSRSEDEAQFYIEIANQTLAEWKRFKEESE